MILIKFPSHRQREKGLRLLGERQAYFSMRRKTGYGVYEINPADIDTLKQSGISFTVLRTPHDDMMKCMKWY